MEIERKIINEYSKSSTDETIINALNELIYAKGFGYCDVENKLPNTSNMVNAAFFLLPIMKEL